MRQGLRKCGGANGGVNAERRCKSSACRRDCGVVAQVVCGRTRRKPTVVGQRNEAGTFVFWNIEDRFVWICAIGMLV